MDLELINKNILDIYECEMDGIERIYSLSPEYIYFKLHYTYPILFRVNGFSSTSNTWKSVLADYAVYLKDKVDLLKFHPRWSQVPIFTAVPRNMKCETQISKSLYMKYNFLPEKIWELIIELTNYANIPHDAFVFKIKRYPASEPKGIRKEMIRAMKDLMTIFLENKKTKDELNKMFGYLKAINTINKKICNSGYDNIYLITDKNVLYNFIYDFTNICEQKNLLKENDLQIVKQCLNDYYNFFIELTDSIKQWHKKTEIV